MAKGLFASLKGVDAFGKVSWEPWSERVGHNASFQTTEDVKVKTRTGALRKTNIDLSC